MGKAMSTKDATTLQQKLELCQELGIDPRLLPIYYHAIPEGFKAVGGARIEDWRAVMHKQQRIAKVAIDLIDALAAEHGEAKAKEIMDSIPGMAWPEEWAKESN